MAGVARRRWTGVLVCAIAFAAMLWLAPAFARAATGPYVSLGDSYTSAPLVPVPTGNPIGCGRSTNNYPSDVARVIAPSSFTHACQDHYQASGSDPNLAAIDATGPKVAGVLQGIHQRSPSARVLIVGYPDGLPVNGSNCWPVVPLSSGDIKYFNSLEQRLNSVIASAAGANNATFVDTFQSSIGHDACKPPGVAWVNGIVPNSV